MASPASAHATSSYPPASVTRSTNVGEVSIPATRWPEFASHRPIRPSPHPTSRVLLPAPRDEIRERGKVQMPVVRVVLWGTGPRQPLFGVRLPRVADLA